MSAIPLVSNFQGDFVLQLIVVEPGFTMDQVAEAAAYHSVGRRVAARPGNAMRVRCQGSETFFPRNMTVAESHLQPMQCVEVMWEPEKN